jgi:MFS family permease
MAGAFLIAVPAQFYAAFMNLYLNEVGVRAAATRMTLGQASEGTFMLLLPWLLPRLGVKWLLLAGMAGWVMRYALLALNGPAAMEPLLYGAILLHGLCYGCFFLTAQIYVAERADVRIRAAAQGFFTLVALGVGSLLGGWAAGSVVDAFALPAAAAPVHDWRSIWLIPSAAALVVTVVFALAFRPGPSPRPVAALPAPD